MKITKTRAAWLKRTSLAKGSHDERDREYCVMEAVAYIAGEPHSDSPVCACPYLTAFLIDWNDNLPNNNERNRLLKPLIPQVVGTAVRSSVVAKRELLSRNWLVRTYLPYLFRVAEIGETVASYLEKWPVIKGDSDFRKAADAVASLEMEYLDGEAHFRNAPMGLNADVVERISIRSGVSSVLDTSDEFTPIRNESDSFPTVVTKCLARFFNNQSLIVANRKGWPKKINPYDASSDNFADKVFKPIISKSEELVSKLVSDMCKIK